jgi:hypothetical protein
LEDNFFVLSELLLVNNSYIFLKIWFHLRG